MKFLSQILFFLGGVGVFNSFFISIYLITSSKFKNLSNRLFGLFLFMLSLRVLKSLFYAFSTEEPIPFLQSGPALFLFIGPLLFSYVLSSLKPNSFFVNHWKTHLLIWAFVVISLMVFIPFRENVVLNKELILPLVNAQWFIYILISGVFLRSTITSFKKATVTEKWLLLLLLGMFVLWYIYFFIDFKYFISGSITFSILFYSFLAYFLFDKKTALILFPKNKKDKSREYTEEVARLVIRLKEMMGVGKLYKNPELKLADVAQQLEMSPHDLSRLINEGLNMSFTDFVNQYRVEEAKRLIEVNGIYTVEAIGNQSGFKSKSAFYKAFKKFSGTTPAKYKAKY